MKSEFIVGDVVALRSGGPSMTVTHIDRGVVYLAWHAEDRSLQMASLPGGALVSVRQQSRLGKELDDDIPF